MTLPRKGLNFAPSTKNKITMKESEKLKLAAESLTRSYETFQDAFEKIQEKTGREFISMDASMGVAYTQMQDLMSNIAVEEMSKEKAARYLDMRRSNFDTKIANGEAPKGKKLSGFKELRWYRQATCPERCRAEF